MASTILSKGLNKISLSGQPRHPTDNDYIKHLDYEDLERRFNIHKYYPVYIHNNGVSTPTLKSMIADKPIYSKANKHLKCPKKGRAKRLAKKGCENIRVKPPTAEAVAAASATQVAEPGALPPYQEYEEPAMPEPPVGSPLNGREARKAHRQERHDEVKEHIREKRARRREHRESRHATKMEARSARAARKHDSTSALSGIAYSDFQTAGRMSSVSSLLSGPGGEKNYTYADYDDEKRSHDDNSDGEKPKNKKYPNRHTIDEHDEDDLAQGSFAPHSVGAVFQDPFASNRYSLTQFEAALRTDKMSRPKKRNNSIASKFLNFVTGNSDSPPQDSSPKGLVPAPAGDLQLRATRSFDQTKSTLTSNRKSQKSAFSKFRANDSTHRRLSDEIPITDVIAEYL